MLLKLAAQLTKGKHLSLADFIEKDQDEM